MESTLFTTTEFSAARNIFNLSREMSNIPMPTAEPNIYLPGSAISQLDSAQMETLNLFYERDQIDFIFKNLRGLVTTIWILIASVQIVTM